MPHLRVDVARDTDIDKLFPLDSHGFLIAAEPNDQRRAIAHRNGPCQRRIDQLRGERNEGKRAKRGAGALDLVGCGSELDGDRRLKGGNRAQAQRRLGDNAERAPRTGNQSR